jgi:hypothetical protein
MVGPKRRAAGLIRLWRKGPAATRKSFPRSRESTVTRVSKGRPVLSISTARFSSVSVRAVGRLCPTADPTRSREEAVSRGHLTAQVIGQLPLPLPSLFCRREWTWAPVCTGETERNGGDGQERGRRKGAGLSLPLAHGDVRHQTRAAGLTRRRREGPAATRNAGTGGSPGVLSSIPI